MPQPIHVAVIGTGRIGRLHAGHLAFRLPDASLLAVADPRLDAAQACAMACRIPRAVADYRELLDDPAIEAVAVCSATDTHARIIEDAAAAGKHIFCEKPISYDLAAIDRALAAVEAAGVIFQVGFNRRFDPNFQRVREIVASGEIGTPHILRITSRDPAPPPIEYVRVSGGIFLDMTIHDFDMARYLIGEEVVEVYATGGVLVDPAIGQAGDIDTAIVTLCFASGAIGTIDNSRKAVYGYDQRVEVFGSAGAVTVSNNTPHRAVVSKADGIHGPNPLYFFVERYVESYIAEMKAFLESVRTGTTPPVTGVDGRIPVVMGLAAGKSLAENRPVRLTEIG
jgi:myo-inositol 2-dehydrogenase/D-chiro-inositol 1-dehydrogenase